MLKKLILSAIMTVLVRPAAADEASHIEEAIVITITQKSEQVARNEPMVVNLEIYNPTKQPVRLFGKYPQRMGVTFRPQGLGVRRMSRFSSVVTAGPPPADMIVIDPLTTAIFPIVANRYIQFKEDGIYELHCSVFIAVKGKPLSEALSYSRRLEVEVRGERDLREFVDRNLEAVNHENDYDARVASELLIWTDIPRVWPGLPAIVKRFPDLSSDVVQVITAIADTGERKRVIESMISPDIDIGVVCQFLRLATREGADIDVQRLSEVIGRRNVDVIYWVLDYLHAHGKQSALPLVAGLDEHPNAQIAELAKRVRQTIVKKLGES